MFTGNIGNKVPYFKTVFNIVLSRVCPPMHNPAKTDVQYQKLTARYSNGVPITGRFERERDALYGVSIFKDDLKKVRTGITLSVSKHNDGETQSFR